MLSNSVTQFPTPRHMLDAEAKEQRKQANLRCREHVALHVYERDFHLLPRLDQHRIMEAVRVTMCIYDLAREGYLSPLPKDSARRAELEPEVQAGRAS